MQAGPFSGSAALGPAELELTVDPARVGSNQVHLYLFNARSGAQFAQIKELDVTATLPEKSIGPLPLEPQPRRPRPLHGAGSAASASSGTGGST